MYIIIGFSQTVQISNSFEPSDINFSNAKYKNIEKSITFENKS